MVENIVDMALSKYHSPYHSRKKCRQNHNTNQMETRKRLTWLKGYSPSKRSVYLVQ